jgi:hypothetical protein
MVLSARSWLALAAIAAAAVMMVQAAFAAPANTGVRPGWGFGDENHVHTGPPGQSVAPQQ